MRLRVEKIILVTIISVIATIFIGVGMLGLKPERFIICSIIAGVVGVIIAILVSKNEKFIK